MRARILLPVICLLVLGSVGCLLGPDMSELEDKRKALQDVSGSSLLATGVITALPVGPVNGTIDQTGGGVIEFEEPEVVPGLDVGCEVTFDIEPDMGDGERAINIVIDVCPSVCPADEGTIITEPIVGDLIINPGEFVTLKTTVTGDVTVNDGEFLMNSAAAVVTGSVNASNGSQITVCGSSVQGDVRMAGNSNATINNGTVGGDVDSKNGSLTVTGSSVGENIRSDEDITVTIDGNTCGKKIRVTESGTVTVTDNTVGGDLKVEKCTDVRITDCEIGGHLQVKGNTSANVADNDVSGKLQIDQTHDVTGAKSSVKAKKMTYTSEIDEVLQEMLGIFVPAAGKKIDIMIQVAGGEIVKEKVKTKDLEAEAETLLDELLEEIRTEILKGADGEVKVKIKSKKGGGGGGDLR